MKTSGQMTSHILARAGSNSECDNYDFAVIDCRGWQYRMGNRLRDTGPFEAPEGLLPFRFYDNCVDFYVSEDDEIEALPGKKDHTFVHLEEGGENGFDRPESRLEATP